MSKERPILMNSEMVRAILDGRKTQTRRIVKPIASHWAKGCYHRPDGRWIWVTGERPDNGQGEGVSLGNEPFKCPYGKPGDRLWVRETWQGYRQTSYEYDEWEAMESPKDRHDNAYVPVYQADKKNFPEKWFPSIHMPHEYSRITLEITGMRVERLRDISEADSIAEGLRVFPFEDSVAYAWKDGDFCGHASATGAYRALWESINGPGSWDANPWIWVIEFKCID